MKDMHCTAGGGMDSKKANDSEMQTQKKKKAMEDQQGRPANGCTKSSVDVDCRSSDGEDDGGGGPSASSSNPLAALLGGYGSDSD